MWPCYRRVRWWGYSVDCVSQAVGRALDFIKNTDVEKLLKEYQVI